MQKLKNIQYFSSRQELFLYPILFQENVYVIAYNRFVNESSFRRETLSDSKNYFHFFAMKRSIEKMRGNFFLIVSTENEPDPDTESESGESIGLEEIREAFTIIFERFLPIHSGGSERFLRKRNDWNSSQSIQSVFPFMEDNSFHPNSLLDTSIPYHIHPENILRILRRKIKDVLFLHPLRLLLHENEISTISDSSPSSYRKKTQLSVFLWNLATHEFEDLLNDFWKFLYKFRPIPYSCLLDRNQSVQKLQHMLNPGIATGKNIVERNVSINYVRFRNNFVITVDGTNPFTKKWKYYLLRFWQKYIRSRFRSYRMSQKKLFGNSFSFLGYNLGVETRRIIAQVKIVNYFVITNLFAKHFLCTIPIPSLIKSLAKENYCDTSGRPTCKLSRTVLTDDGISERFDRISRSFCHYHSGCCNRKGLYQIQYIPRFSRAKTLACKHKGTIRSVWKKYGSNSFTHSIPSRKAESTAPNYWRGISGGIKFRYLHMIQMNPSAASLQEMKTSKYS